MATLGKVVAAIPTMSASTHTVSVTGYGSGGEGVARLDDGRVVFIRGAARGDELEIALTKEQPRSARADIVRVLTPSPYRIEPDCPVYPECGGCDFRHITYAEELDAKLRRVNDAIGRIGGLSARVDEILHTGQTDGYRNKAVFHSDGVSLGFYRTRSHDVISIDSCHLLSSDLNTALMSLRPGGDVALRSGRNGLGQPLKSLQSGGEVTLRSGRNGLGQPLKSLNPDGEVTLRSGRNGLGQPLKRLKPGGEVTLRSGLNGLSQPLEEELDGLVFHVSGFFQVNTGAALLLYQKVREYAALSKNETLFDLYCGVGTMTLFVGRDAGHALGVELNPDAVDCARENALRNGLAHVEFVCADAANWDADAHKPDCVIVDPPRSGLSRGAINKILELSPSRVVYVSCDPATLARDLRLFDGYAVQDICAVDMFPRTANVECCCLLGYSSSRSVNY